MNVTIKSVGSVTLREIDENENAYCSVEIVNTDGGGLFSLATGGSSRGSFAIYADVSRFFQAVGFTKEQAVVQAEKAAELLELAIVKHLQNA